MFIFSIEPILGASKSLNFKKQVKAKCTTFLKFMRDNNLLLIDPFDELGSVRHDLILNSEDLTAEGLDFWKAAFFKWSSARDKDGNYENIQILERELEKIKE